MENQMIRVQFECPKCTKETELEISGPGRRTFKTAANPECCDELVIDLPPEVWEKAFAPDPRLH